MAHERRVVLQRGFLQEERSPWPPALRGRLSDRVPGVAGRVCGVGVRLPDSAATLERFRGLHLIYCASWQSMMHGFVCVRIEFNVHISLTDNLCTKPIFYAHIHV